MREVERITPVLEQAIDAVLRVADRETVSISAVLALLRQSAPNLVASDTELVEAILEVAIAMRLSVLSDDNPLVLPSGPGQKRTGRSDTQRQQRRGSTQGTPQMDQERPSVGRRSERLRRHDSDDMEAEEARKGIPRYCRGGGN